MLNKISIALLAAASVVSLCMLPRTGTDAAKLLPAQVLVIAQEDGQIVVESDNGLNLRARPSADSDVLYVLPYGMVLNVLGEGENGFLYVQWGGYTGYVSGDYVTPFGAQ